MLLIISNSIRYKCVFERTVESRNTDRAAEGRRSMGQKIRWKNRCPLPLATGLVGHLS